MDNSELAEEIAKVNAETTTLKTKILLSKELGQARREKAKAQFELTKGYRFFKWLLHK